MSLAVKGVAPLMVALSKSPSNKGGGQNQPISLIIDGKTPAVNGW
jgi:hypothetical protein